jgi:hypothetical protein
MFFDPYNRRGRGPWAPQPAQPRAPRYPAYPAPVSPYARFDDEPIEPELVAEPPPAAKVMPVEPPPPAPVAPPVAPPVDKAQLAGALRELEAAKARVERDAKLVAEETKKKLVVELLPVLDNLDRTIAAGDSPAMIEGVRLVRAQLEGVLRGYGVARIEATGAPFDPAIHDAITQVPVADPAAHKLVVDQLEPGYRFGEKLLRPAKVVVGAFRAAA